MIIYLLRRILLASIILLILTLISFNILYFKNASLLSNQPIFVAYPHYLLNIFQGNLGYSLINNQPITQQLKLALAATVELGTLAVIVALILGVPLAIIAGMNRKKTTDKLINGFVLLGLSTPTYWLALLLVTFFSFSMDWLPVNGRYDLSYPLPTITGFMFVDLFLTDNPNRPEMLVNMIEHALLPVLTLAIGPMTEIIKLLRANVITVVKENYIKAASTRGLSRLQIIKRHIIHNAFPPIIPQLGLQFSTLFTLTMIIEVIFNWNGIGAKMIYALNNQDFAVISAGVLIIGCLVLLTYILADIIGLIMNPLKHKELYALQ